MKKLGTGGGNSKLVHPGIKTGTAAKATAPCAASELGQSTAFKKESVEVGPAYHSPVPLGNSLTTNVGAGSPGAGRTVMRSGSQGTHGAPAPGVSNEPRGFDVRGRLKGEI